jgi:hypothetical protein
MVWLFPLEKVKNQRILVGHAQWETVWPALKRMGVGSPKLRTICVSYYHSQPSLEASRASKCVITRLDPFCVTPFVTIIKRGWIY